MTSRTRSQSWIAVSLTVVLAALLLDPLAHEPKLTHQIARDGRQGLVVARVGFRATSAHAGAIVAKVGRMMRGMK